MFLDDKFNSFDSRRHAILQDLGMFDSLVEKEFDEITQLAVKICAMPEAYISLIDRNGQWFKSRFGLDCGDPPKTLSFCDLAIQSSSEHFIVRDSREDPRFSLGQLATMDPEIIFYAGIPLMMDQGTAVGTLCVIDDKPRDLSELELTTLKVLAKSVVNLLKNRRHVLDVQQQECNLMDAMSFSSPFFMLTDTNGVLTHVSPKLKLCNSLISEHVAVSDSLNFIHPFDFTQWLDSPEVQTTRLSFFELSTKQRFKFSAKKIGSSVLIVCAPVINEKFPLSNYNLGLKDFANHDYIAEFLFLQQTTTRSLKDSKLLIEKISKSNLEILKAKDEIDSIAKFPDENPNPILRFDMEGRLLYKNKATRDWILGLFNVDNDQLYDADFLHRIATIEANELDESLFIIERSGYFFSCALKLVSGSYVNIYLTNISSYIDQIKKRESELNELSERIDEQRAFYEHILNNLPADIAVFDLNHKYRFVNPKGIKDPEMRRYIIGKTDYDYCDFRGLSYEIADKRKELFSRIIAEQKFVEWEDEHFLSTGQRQVVLRRMGPLFDENGKFTFVVGYGVDISERKEVEERLQQTYANLILRENFLNRVSEGIQVANSEGQLVYINQSAAQRLGVNPTDFSNYYVWDFEKSIPDFEAWMHHFETMKALKIMQIETVNENLRTGEINFAEVTVKCEEINGAFYLIAATRDVTSRKNAEFALLEKAKFQQILTDLSSKYINLPLDEIENGVQEALGLIGRFFRVDRAYVFEYNHTSRTCSNTYEWCSDNVRPEIQNLKSLSFDNIQEWMASHLDGKAVNISNVSELSTGKLKQGLENQHIKSVLAVPMMDDNICVGFVGFDAVNTLREFSMDEENLLFIFAQMLVNLDNRARYLHQIESSRLQLETINANLEQIVDEKTANNNNLIQSLYNQDKLALIGEIAAGIAHDLNTPLGAIKVGVENVTYSLNKIFSESIHELDAEGLECAVEFSHRKSEVLPIGGLQAIKEKKMWMERLEKYHIPTGIEAQEIAQSLVNIRLDHNDAKVLNTVLSQSNPIKYLEFVFHLKSIFSFLQTMHQASERSAQVVMTLRSYLKANSDILKPISLNKSIQTVIQIFNHELKYKIALGYNVPDDLLIMGYESKLFQLWSNLIKNAVEAMTDGGELNIEAHRKAKCIHVCIANTGPEIPKEIKHHIFDKFFTTKDAQNGTGLGLSIVKKVIEEHGARINVHSSPARTMFEIIFDANS